MPELLDQYRLTDIRNVPQATVAHVNGPMAADPAVPTFQITYSDGSSVETTLEMAIGGWKVSSVVPVDSPAGPAGPVPSPAAPEPIAPEPAPSEDTTTPASPPLASFRSPRRTMTAPTRLSPRPAAGLTHPVRAA